MESPQWFFTKALSHRQKVLRLYKRALKQAEYWYLPDIQEVRYHKVMLRARFEINKNERDVQKARRLYTEGIQELWEKQHPAPFQYPDDPYGVACERWPALPDNILDRWSDHEKALYPEYFKKREQAKKDIVEIWNKMMDDKESRLRKELEMSGPLAVSKA